MKIAELRMMGLLLALAAASVVGAEPVKAAGTGGGAGSTPVRCVAKEIVVAEPAQMVNNAVVRGSKLYLPDWAAGLRVIDLSTGKDLERIKVLSPRATEEQAPLYVASGEGGFAVSGQKKAWFLFDKSWKPAKAFLSPKADPTGHAILFPDRFVVYGFAASEVTGGDEAWLFVQYIEDGRVVPLMVYPPGEAYEEQMRTFQFRAILTGGVAPLPGGGWVAVDPVSYRIFVFDSSDRLVRTFLGSNPRFRPPNLDGFPENWAAQGREAVFRWWLTQPLVKKPVILDGNRIGVVIGIPDGESVQRHELDIYELDGAAVAVGLEIEGLRVGRAVVADAEPGRLLVVSQERNWPVASRTSVWEISVRNGARPGRSGR
jgi:hypothetical protein